MCGVRVVLLGADGQDPECLREARAFGKPLLDGVGPMPLPALQSAFDGSTRQGDQWYWRADFVKEIPDEAVALHAEHGAATADLEVDDAPVPDRRRGVTRGPRRDALGRTATPSGPQVIVGVDPDPANAATIRDWCVDYWNALHPYSMGGAYVNFMMDEGQDRVRATYGDNYARLAQVKRRYDPDNLFRVNQNIQPD